MGLETDKSWETGRKLPWISIGQEEELITETVKQVNFKGNKLSSFCILTEVWEMCKKNWNMTLGLSRQAVVRLTNLGFTAVNSKVA